MNYLYNYGISQEDVLTEIKALELQSGDSLLCIASAGEIPLNIAALLNVNIVATDTSLNQLYLCRIKQCAAANLDSIRSASFLGYMKISENAREKIYTEYIEPILPSDDKMFWKQNIDYIRKGVINEARFERYMRKVSSIGLLLVGRKNLYRLFDCESLEEQKNVFENYISGLFVRGIFRIAFHPKVYKNRGIDPAGLTHSGARNISEFFFLRFRNFCCSTLARKNYYLQYTFFNQVLFPEALPEFLQHEYHNSFVKNIRQIEYRHSSLESILTQSKNGQFNRIHLSNIGDWMSKEKMGDLFYALKNITCPGARVVMRYIHLKHLIPGSIPELKADYNSGETLALTDRYPFYFIVPIERL